MPRSKQIQEQMRNIIDIHQSKKGYRGCSKALGLQRTTVRAIIHKWRKHGTVVNIPRSGQSTKMTPRAHRQLIQEVTKKDWTTSKALQASLEWLNSMKETGWKWHLLGEFKGENHCWPKRTFIYHKISWWSPRLFGNHSVDWRDKSGTSWKVCIPLHLA